MQNLLDTLLASNPLPYLFPHTAELVLTGFIVLCAGTVLATYMSGQYGKSPLPVVVLGIGMILELLGAIENTSGPLDQMNMKNPYANQFPWLTDALAIAFVALIVLAIRAMCNRRRAVIINLVATCTYLMGAALVGVTFSTPAQLNAFPVIGTNTDTWVAFTTWMWASLFFTMCLEVPLLAVAGVTQYYAHRQRTRMIFI